VWHVVPEEVRDPGLLGRYRELLSGPERARQERFRRARDRHRYLVTRALVRATLSQYADVDPRAWAFREGAHGRPEIAGPVGTPRLVFNVSHADGLIACLVGLDREIGIDVENRDRAGRTLEIAERFFSPTEAAALRRVAENGQRARFLEYWTLKEAYLKARGIGLRLPLESFSLHVEEGAPIRVSFDPTLDDDPASWQFALLHPTPRHVLAVALRRRGEPDLAIELEPCVPLVGC
jgi:4'-phosphopantetheinyl transferase